LQDGRLEVEEEYEEELELEYGEEELEEEEELLETILCQVGGDKEASPPHHNQVSVQVHHLKYSPNLKNQSCGIKIVRMEKVRVIFLING
jgi:hypothetical protein